jgi:hypothetical protein
MSVNFLYSTGGILTVHARAGFSWCNVIRIWVASAVRMRWLSYPSFRITKAGAAVVHLKVPSAFVRKSPGAAWAVAGPDKNQFSDVIDSAGALDRFARLIDNDAGYYSRTHVRGEEHHECGN